MDQDGKTKNPTKSLCDKYVFNTVLTRSKSLIVAAGSPYLLLKIEKSMKAPKFCWSHFMLHCIENNTFIIPPEIEINKTRFLKTLKEGLISDGIKLPSIMPQSAAKSTYKAKLSTITQHSTLSLLNDKYPDGKALYILYIYRYVYIYFFISKMPFSITQ